MRNAPPIVAGPKVLSALCAEKWHIKKEALRLLLRMAARQRDPLALADTPAADSLATDERAYVRDGVAVLRVCGPVFRYESFFTWFFGGTSYERLARDLDAALDDSRVKAVLLDIDSPGGEANGCGEFCERLYRARGRKPLVAYTGGMACSAAYWIASAAEIVVAHESAEVGSIGTLCTMVDDSKALEMEGVEELTIVSAHAPEKIHGWDGITDDAVAALRATLNALEKGFVGAVARNRGVSEEKVVSDFGRGGTLIAGLADQGRPTGIDAGLVDEIGSFEDTLVALVRLDSRSPRLNAGRLIPRHETSMAIDPETKNEFDRLHERCAALEKRHDRHDEKLDAVLKRMDGDEPEPGLTAEATDLLALAGVKDATEFKALLAASKSTVESGTSAQTRIQELERQIAELKKTGDAAKAEEILTGLKNSGRLTPAVFGSMKAKGQHHDLALCQKLAEILPAAPEVAQQAAPARPAESDRGQITAPGSGDVALTRDEIRIARIAGITEAEALAAKKQNAEAWKIVRGYRDGRPAAT